MPARILIVEDDPLIRALMASFLRQRHDVACAEDGEKGLALALRSPRPELIISDIDLPKMDGFELVQRLRRDPATRSIRAVAVSAFTLAGMQERALDAGFDAFIAKPVAPQAFVEQVERFLA